MPCSPAKLAANIANARKSTGPRTVEGKERSRANALKHGFCSEVVRAPEDAEAVRDRAKLYFRTLKPQNDFHAWIVEEVAVLTLRIDRIERIERRERDRVALRAEHFWDDDRRSEAEAVGAGLALDPAGVRDRLRQTLHGCEWMIARWALLARAADRKGGWDEVQAALAHDLMGTPAGFRDDSPGEMLDLDGRVEPGPSDPAGLARREIAALRERMAELAGADALDRTLAEADLSDARTPELRRLRRYESALNRRLRWCLDQLQRESKYYQAHPSLKPHFDPEPEAQADVPVETTAEAASPAGTTPPAPEPEAFADAEVGTAPASAAPAPSRARRDPSRLKAEARREAKRSREAQRLRA